MVVTSENLAQFVIQLGQKIEQNKSCYVVLEEDDFDWTKTVTKAKKNLQKQYKDRDTDWVNMSPHNVHNYQMSIQ
jgi:hypothetical protein